MAASRKFMGELYLLADKCQVAFLAIDNGCLVVYSAAMKFLRRLMVNIPDQVLTTGLMVGVGYVFIRGIMAVWVDPPSIILYLIILGVGAFFGLEATRREDSQSNKPKDND
jgi:hypothetical protein